MKISILCSSPHHPINGALEQWASRNDADHEIRLLRTAADLCSGDFLFLISCSEIVTKEQRSLFDHVLVLHASDLPLGRGWSPHVWEIVRGAEHITVTLLEAEDAVDCGRIWAQKVVSVPRHALHDEINDLLFTAEIELMELAISTRTTIVPRLQSPDIRPTYYPRRTPDDSELSPHKTIAEQFDLMRVCDPVRFPAFFMLHGHKYRLTIEKMDDAPND